MRKVVLDLEFVFQFSAYHYLSSTQQVLARRAHQQITYGSRTLSSIESYPTSCCREETLRIEMGLVATN